MCVTARITGKYVYVIDVFRQLLAFPELKKKAISLALEHNATDLLFEDQASGQQLLQELYVDRTPRVPVPIPCRPETDKESLVHGISAIIEAGQLLLPADAPWLAEFKSELLGFPNTKVKDQVDALSQLLAWTRSRLSAPTSRIKGPILVWEDDSGRTYSSDEDEYGSKYGNSDEDPCAA